MSISEKEKKIILDNAKFLVDKGYVIEIDDYTITFVNDYHKIIIGYPPMSNLSEVGIEFIKENNYFFIGWIAVVRDNLFVDHKDKLNSALQLLQYIEDNYEKLIDFDYCLESRKLISEYIKNKKNG